MAFANRVEKSDDAGSRKEDYMPRLIIIVALWILAVNCPPFIVLAIPVTWWLLTVPYKGATPNQLPPTPP
jgi:hypothetical protein